MLFIFREFNDLDHMTPIIDKALELNPKETIITCINPDLDIENDSRIKYLQNKYNVELKYIYDVHCYSAALKLFSHITNRILSPKSSFKILKSLKSKFRKKLYNSWLKRKLYNTQWMESLIQDQDVGVLIVDYGSQYKFIYETISAVCRSNSIPIIGVPHGMDATVNNFVTNYANLERDPEHLEKTWGWIDSLIVASDRIKHKYSKEGLPSNKMHVLGNPRFTKAWHDKYKSIIERSSLQTRDQKLKLVFFDHGKRNRINTNNVYETLHAIDQLSFTDLIIKPHTRELLSDLRLQDIGHISNEHSINLIQWADVVINHLSSIVIDAYHLKKIFIYPNYFTDNSMIWGKYDACWEVASTDEMISAISSIQTGDYQIPYSQDSVDKLLNEQIYGNRTDTDVSLRYLNHIKSTIEI